jgi:sulfonate transport system permease protein
MTDLSQTAPITSPRHSSARAWRRGLVLPAVLVVLWGIMTRISSLHSPLLVPLDQILAAPFVDEAGRQIWAALAESLARFAAGFLAGTLPALPSGS